MRKILLLLCVLFLCSQSTFADRPGQQLLAKNKSITSYLENDNGIPVFIQGNIREKVVKGYEVNAAMDFFNENKSLYRMTAPSDELHVNKIDIDNLGMSHVRFKQYYRNIPVLGNEMIVHFTNSGTLQTINGAYTPIKNLNTKPNITSDIAIKLGQDDLEIDFGEGKPGPAELVIFPWQKENYLCWRYFLYSDSPMGRWEYLVDAHTGDILFKANRIMNAEAIGTGVGVMGNNYSHIDTYDNGSNFEMTDYTRRANNDIHGHGGQMASNARIRTYIASTTLPGSVATDADNYWDSANYAPAVDGHMYSALVYDWFLSRFGRNSYDDNGSSMTTSVNYSAEGDNNAYWNGSQIVVWSWSSGWRSLAGCPDVIAHEWSHAVTETTSGLVYQLESGALNESFSDMMGAAFEFAHDTLDTPDWLMGENGRLTGDGFRDMQNPHAKGDPDTYGTSDPYWIDVNGCTPTNFNDYCGVHTNSGVGNKWYSLLSDGGIHNGVTVNGLGYDTAILIAYRANTVYWTATTDYAQAAVGTISAAHDLDPSGAWEWEVAQAWNAVGVSTPNPSLTFDYPNGIPITSEPGKDTTFEVVVTGTLGGVPVDNSGQIYISINGQPYQSSAMTQTTANHYTATIPAISCGDVVEFYISADLTSPAQTVYDGSQQYPYKIIPATGSVLAFEDDFESDLGWTISGGDWARGVPTGGSGDHGGPDPTSGNVGANVMGYNLNGGYTDNMPEYHVTSPAIDCSALGATRLKFWRWLGVEQPAYDHAYIRVSNDGTNWTTVWQNDVTISDNVWSEQDVDISSVADGQSTVYVRFTMGTTDAGWTYCGWNIDDVRVEGSECVAGPTLAISTTTLPDWTAGTAYSQQLQATGGTGNLVWSDKNGDLVGTGLTLSSTGLLSGTVTTGQAVSFTARVTDDAPAVAEQVLNFTVNPSPQITTTTIPDWTEGLAYSQQLSATGGTGGLVYSDKNNDLVGTGLSLSTSGLLSGTPTAGSVSFTAQVTDNVGAVGEQVLSLTVNPIPQVTTLSLPDWTNGIAYSEQLSATGGTGSLVYTDKNSDLTGTGLSLSSTGLLSGIPNAGAISFTVLVTDDLGVTDEQILSFTINAAVSIDPLTLPDWTDGEPFSQQLTANGGTGTLTFTDKNNDLTASGLTLSVSGLLSGIPVTGTYNFTCQVTDSIGSIAEQPFSLLINPALSFITVSLPDGNVGQPYSEQISVTGGTGVLTYTDKNSDLTGTGLTLSSSGLISGTVSTPQLISFTAIAADEIGASIESAFSFTISQAITIDPISLPDWTAGVSYSEQLTASGGTGPLTYSDKNGDLAASGLTLSSSGLLSGTPLAGTYNFICLVTDSLGATAEEPGSVLINGALNILTATIPEWTVSIPYSLQVLRSGGTGIVNFIDKNGDLTGSGVSISSTGQLNGIPTTDGSFTFTVQATDAVGAVDEQLLTLVLNPVVSITTTSVPDGNLGENYSEQLQSSGGTGVMNWSDKNSDLTGTGLSLQSDGLLTGIPVSESLISFTAQVVDDVGSTDEQTFNFTIVIPYICGDADGSGVVDIGDLVYEVQYMFGVPPGPEPVPLASFDTDASGVIDIADLVYQVTYMFNGGPEPICGTIVK